MKKKYLVCMLILGMFCLKLPTAKANLSVSYLNVNKTTFFPDETIIINGSWYAGYLNPTDYYYAQYRIYNTTEFLSDPSATAIWESVHYVNYSYYPLDDPPELIERVENVSISDLMDIEEFEGSTELYIAIYECYRESGMTSKKNIWDYVNITITSRAYFELEHLELNKDVFYPNHTLIIDSVWDMSYYEPVPCYTQFHIYNSSQFIEENLVWESETFSENGLLAKNLELPLENIVNSNLSGLHSKTYYLSLLYQFNETSNYYANKTFTITKPSLFRFEHISFNKPIFFLNETILINTSWNLIYTPPEECYIQLKIFNNSNLNESGLLWQSNEFTEAGYIQNNLSVAVPEVVSFSVENDITLYVSLEYFNRNLNNMTKLNIINNKTILISPLETKFDSNGSTFWVNIILPTGIGSAVGIIGVVLYITKRNKKKNVEDITIQF